MALVLIDRTEGTIIGDMVNSGGLDQAFNGNTSQTAGGGASKFAVDSTGSWYVGKTLASAKKFGQAVYHGSNNHGVINTVDGNNVTLTAYGKTGSAPANSSDGTPIGSVTFVDTADESAGRTITSTDTTTSWDHIWVRGTHDTTSRAVLCAELVLYEHIVAEGTLASTLGSATAASTGKVAVKGTSSKTLAAATLSAAGTVKVAGTLSRTLEAASATGAGTVLVSGTGERTLASATLAATGTAAVQGALTATLGAASLSAAGSVPVTGVLDATLGDATVDASGSGAAVTLGGLAATLDDVTLVATGQVAGGDAVPVQPGGGIPARRPHVIWTEYREEEEDEPPVARIVRKRKRRTVAEDEARASRIEELLATPAQPIGAELAAARAAMAEMTARQSAALNELRVSGMEQQRRAIAAEEDEILVLLLAA